MLLIPVAKVIIIFVLSLETKIQLLFESTPELKNGCTLDPK